MDWQPARIFPGHASENYYPIDVALTDRITKTVVRIRKYNRGPFDDFGCDGQYFELHPEDVKRFGLKWENRFICEHEILTD